ncbi:MAG: 2-dehydropantoate 2-reductase [Rhodospirillaceae bacterium]|nr:2-dehydropantoate 2-reductase [Rhodospirillaceae bacterium]
MKICIYGAGAVGGYVGARLCLAGEAEVSLIARGPHLAAMKANGLKLISEGEEHVVHPFCTDDPAEVGPQDYVLVTMKAHSVPAAVDRMTPLFGPHTAVIPGVNGVPWWYFHKLEGPWEGHRIEMVDPGGKQWDVIGPDRVIGCVVYPAASIVEPGVIHHADEKRMLLGELDGSRSERVTALSRAMINAGLKAPVRPKIRDDVWVKLWGNLSFNSVSALTGGTLEQIARDPGVRAVVRAMMVEGQAIGEKLGVRFPIDVEARIQGAENVGAHKSSTLQDLEAGRPMEIDALTGAVAEVGRLVGVPTPTIDMVYALVRQRAVTAGCYPG